MKPIKFRCWDKQKKLMRLVSNISFGEDGSALTIFFEPAPKGKYYVGFVHGESGVLMQYIGLKDKDSLEIYEGDILEQDNGVRYVVDWIDQIGGFYLSIPNTHRGKEIISCAESQHAGESLTLYTHTIIGNIYKNETWESLSKTL